MQTVGTPSKKVTFTLTHETPTQEGWHFPMPEPQADYSTLNSTVEVTVIADGNKIELPRGAQIELKKDEPSDVNYYETFITDIPLDKFLKISNAKTVQFELQSATFN
jgi:hypothetical protein